MSRKSELPGFLRGLRRSIQLGFETEPRLFLAALSLSLVAYLPTALTAVWLKVLADGIVGHRSGEVLLAAIGIGSFVALGWLLPTIGMRVQNLFRARAAVWVEATIARLQATTAGIEHHERPEILDRLHPLRDQSFLLDHFYSTFMTLCGLVLSLLTTVGLLVSIHPLLALLALCAVPAAMSGTWRAGAERRAIEQSAPHNRLWRHLFDVGTLPAFGKDVRITRTAEILVRRRQEAWLRARRPIWRVRWGNGWFFAGTWTLFSLAYAAALILAVTRLRTTPGNVLLLLAAGGSLARMLSVTISDAIFLRWTLDASSRLAWLEDYASAHRDQADAAVPERLAEGITLDGVSFAYPGTERLVLENVTATLPAGSVIAVVGENGAGKTTLVKLLCRLYEPSAGRIAVDGVDLARIPADGWRERTAGAFQDFMRFEFQARTAVGVGDHPREEDEAAVAEAVLRGGATGVIDRLSAGLATQLGAAWEGGTDLSFGQWQKLALARGFMRERPLLLVLDEPTAALDAETEHALFERFAAESRAAAEDGRITLLVSHRFSTVRMADLILVLDGARLVESGSHEELMARRGLYAELYGIQARAYRS